MESRAEVTPVRSIPWSCRVWAGPVETSAIRYPMLTTGPGRFQAFMPGVSASAHFVFAPVGDGETIEADVVPSRNPRIERISRAVLDGRVIVCRDVYVTARERQTEIRGIEERGRDEMNAVHRGRRGADLDMSGRNRYFEVIERALLRREAHGRGGRQNGIRVVLEYVDRFEAERRRHGIARAVLRKLEFERVARNQAALVVVHPGTADRDPRVDRILGYVERNPAEQLHHVALGIENDGARAVGEIERLADSIGVFP